MSFPLFETKVFAISTLIFLSVLPVNSQLDSIYRLPAGTRVVLTMNIEINSESASESDTFTATVAEPVLNRGVEVLGKGTMIEGRVIQASAAELGKRNGRLKVEFYRLILSGGRTRNLDAVLASELRPHSRNAFGILAILGGAAAGSLIGAVTGGNDGALVGAGLGAGAGTGVTLLRKGENVRIKTGERFEIVLRRDLLLPAQEF